MDAAFEQEARKRVLAAWSGYFDQTVSLLMKKRRPQPGKRARPHFLGEIQKSFPGTIIPGPIAFIRPSMTSSRSANTDGQTYWYSDSVNPAGTALTR